MIIDTEAHENETDFAKDLAALARMVTYARHSAHTLKLDFPVYCLEISLAAVLEEMKKLGVDTSQVGIETPISTAVQSLH